MLDCANFRPITLLSHVYKLLMQIIYKRITPTLADALSNSKAAYQTNTIITTNKYKYNYKYNHYKIII